MKKTLMILLALVLSLGTFVSATAQKKRYEGIHFC